MIHNQQSALPPEILFTSLFYGQNPPREISATHDESREFFPLRPPRGACHARQLSPLTSCKPSHDAPLSVRQSPPAYTVRILLKHAIRQAGMLFGQKRCLNIYLISPNCEPVDFPPPMWVRCHFEHESSEYHLLARSARVFEAVMEICSFFTLP